ncbi:hypothetical protein SprV_0100242400 [Sparganum proliferum]
MAECARAMRAIASGGVWCVGAPGVGSPVCARLAAFNLLVGCRQSSPHDQTTKLNALVIPSSEVSRQLAVLDPDPDSPFQQLLAKYPGQTGPNFSTATPPDDVRRVLTTDPGSAVPRLHVLLPPSV